jgi:dolichyl-phosphate-mannose-protein mannosyltransferase
MAAAASQTIISRVAEVVQRNVVLSRRVSLATAAVVLNLAIALPLAYTLNIWQDEAYTLHTTAAGFGYALQQAITFEQNAPLYFLIVVALRHVGESVFFLRGFSVLCAAATVWVVPSIVRRYIPNADGGPIAIVVACNPFLIWAAVEMRVYALIVLMSALLLLSFYDAFVKERGSGWAAAGYAVCVALALYTQYYLAFIVAAQAIAVALWYRRRILRFLGACVAGGAAFAPMLVTIPAQVGNFRTGFKPPTLAHSFATLATILWHYVVPLPFSGAKLVYAVLTVAIAVALLRYRPYLTVSGGGSILAIAAGAGVLFVVGTHAVGVHILTRHAASLYIPATLGVFAVIAALRVPSRARVAAYTAVVLTALSLLTLASTYRAMATPGDWSRVAAYIRNHERRGEPIAVFEAENALPFAYYYRGPNEIVPIPRGVNFQDYDVTDFIIRNESELNAAMPHSQRLWLITAGQCTSANVAFGCPVLDSFIAGHYRVLSDASFYESRVRLLERTRTQSFQLNHNSKPLIAKTKPVAHQRRKG